ncbi:MAG: tetratricopeptide repeat protein [Prosthecobacter sp.]
MSAARFRIAFSFAGEKRPFVKEVADILAKRFGQEAILYDKYHEAEFARHDLGIYLPKLYGKQSDLIVPVLCPKYDTKRWTGWEWLHIYGLLTKEDGHRVMSSRFEYAEADGLSPAAGFIELDTKTPEQFAHLILERLALNEGKDKDHYTKPVTSGGEPTKPHAPHYLPRLDHFHGREKELAQIRDALRPEKRTWGALIAGPGGMGKTSLAVRAASVYSRDQFDPVIFVSIKDRALEDEGPRPVKVRFVSHYLGILDEIARALGRDDIPRSTPEDRARLILDALTGTRALLILDNLESLTPEDRERIVEFVSDLPGVCKAILTARRRIGRGINLIELDKLDEAAALATLADIAEHNKLLARASVDDHRSLWQATAGIPLLLRWTAGQLGRGSCRTIPAAIAFLRSCPEKNDPLEFIFGDLVNEFTADETQILCALTYFTLPAKVEHIAANAGIEESLAETALGSLANRSLVTDNAEGTHYALVPLVADFLRKKKPEVVAETGNILEKRAFALIMENGWQMHARFPILEAAWPGIAPALDLFLAGDNARLQTVCSVLPSFLEFQGHWDEWFALSRKAELRAVAADDYIKAGWRAYDAGYIHYLRHQADDVLTCADRAAEHWTRANAGARACGSAIRMRGNAHRSKGDYSAAIRDYHKALDLHRSLATESVDVAICLNDLAGAERLSGDFAAAEEHYRAALRVACAVDYVEGRATYTGNLAALALNSKNWRTAETLAREALALSEKVGRQQLIAGDNHRLAAALLFQGRAAEALPHAQTAVEIYTRLGSPDLAAAQATLNECETAA